MDKWGEHENISRYLSCTEYHDGSLQPKEQIAMTANRSRCKFSQLRQDWKDDREDYGTRLESVRGFKTTVGSNPTSSANLRMIKQSRTVTDSKSEGT